MGSSREVSELLFSLVSSLPDMSTAFRNKPLPAACCAQLALGMENVALPSGCTDAPLPADSINAQPGPGEERHTESGADGGASDTLASLPALSTATCCAPLPPRSVNAQPERPKGSEEETGVKGEIRDTGLGLPAWSAAFKNILLPTATGNAQLNPPLPPSSSDINLPPSSSDMNLPPSSSDMNLPPSSSDMNLLADPKNAPLQSCPTKAPVPTDKHSSLCPIMAPPCHQAEDTGPLSQMGALLDQLFQTHSASVGSEEFLRLVGDLFKQGIEAQNQWHHRLMEDRQHNRLSNLEKAQMQLRYNRSSSLSPTPFSQEHFPQFQDVSEDTDWVLLNFEKLCAMCNVPEPDRVFYLPNALKSKAMGCYGDVPMGACCDYPAIKAALLKPYDGEPEIHRVKFRNMTLKAGETFNSFYQRLQYRYDRWMEASDIKQFKDCYRPLVLEQLLQKCPAIVRQKVLKHKGCSPYQAAQIADDHLHLHPEPASQPRLDRCPPPPITDKNTDASLLQHCSTDNESILDLLDLFECRSTFHQLPKSQWVKYLCGKLKGKLLDVCLSIPQEHKRDYDFVKAEILRFYGITPETHRIKFRTIQRQDDQPFTAFYQNLLCHYNRWMAACEVQTIEQCANLMVVEQLLTRCPPEVQGRVTSMQNPPTPEAVARIADKYMILHADLQQNLTPHETGP